MQFFNKSKSNQNSNTIFSEVFLFHQIQILTNNKQILYFFYNEQQKNFHLHLHKYLGEQCTVWIFLKICCLNGSITELFYNKLGTKKLWRILSKGFMILVVFFHLIEVILWNCVLIIHNIFIPHSIVVPTLTSH